MTNSKSAIILATAMALTLCSCSSVNTTENDDSQRPSVSDQNSTAADLPDKPAEEVTLHMAVVTSGENTDFCDEWVKDFNEADNNYKIEFVCYDPYEGLDDPEQGLRREDTQMVDFRIIQDVINTDKIDIFCSYSFANPAKLEILAKKGAFADLYTFMDSDPEINRETLNSRILSLNECDGKLYSIPTRYQIDSMIGDSEYVGNKENWTVDEFIDHWNAAPEGMTFNGCLESEYVYYTVLRPNLPSFVDYENATVNFDCEEFRRMLEFCGSFNSANGEKGEYLYDNPVFVHEQYLCGFCTSALFDDEKTLVGFPTLNRSGAYFEDASSRYAINAKSSPEKQRGAWEFIRSMLTVEELSEDIIEISEYEIEGKTYKQATPEPGFPINNEAFNIQMNDMINGKYSYLAECISGEDSPKWFEPEMTNIVDPDQCKKLLEYMDTVDRWETNLDDTLWEITTEEVMAYLAGENSLDRCVELIQNRTSIWISEQS